MRINTLGIVAVMVCASAALAAEAPRLVAGKVYLDANGNGKLDPGEKGLPGVRVTDSVKFVTTGADGTYSIEMADDPIFIHKGSQVVSVSWPSGTWPTGRWWARMDQIVDAKAVDFGLREDKQDKAFLFAHITDNHSSGGVVENWGKHFPRMGEAVKFVVETGDLGYAGFDSAEKMFGDLARNGATLPVPYLTVPGNHDYVGVHSPEGLKDHPLAGAGGYTKHLGPVRWSFDYAGHHFVGVDFGGPHGGKFEGDPHPIAREFLKNDLDGAKGGGTLFGFIHYPSIRGAAWRPDKFEHVYVFGGHSHSFACWTDGKITYTTMIALWGAGACGLIYVDGKDTEFVYRCAGCKWGDWKGMAQRGQHLNFCPMHHFAYKMMPEIEKVRQAVEKAAPGPLAEGPERGRGAGSRAVDAGPLAGKSVQVELEMAPGTAKTIGLKMHGDSKVLAITWDGTWLSLDGIRVPMPFREWEKSVKIRLIADGKIVQVQVNGMYEVSRPLAATKLKAEAFAEGGSATIEKFDVYKYELPAAQAAKAGRGGRRGK